VFDGLVSKDCGWEVVESVELDDADPEGDIGSVPVVVAPGGVAAVVPSVLEVPVPPDGWGSVGCAVGSELAPGLSGV
jgi:hypothetical protein